MTRLRMRAALAATTTALVAAGCTAGFMIQAASAAPAEENPVAALLAPLLPATSPPTPDGNSPGTGGDAYKPDDPFVDHGNEPKVVPPGTIIAQSFKLFPAKLVTTPGQDITLDNQDVATHNIQTLEGKVKVKSPDAEPKTKVNFKSPTKAGTYDVGCYYHQSMVMKIVVK